MIFESPVTCLITEGELTRQNFEQRKGEVLETLKAAVCAGISMVQIREKQITARQLFEVTRSAASVLIDSKTKILVNGRSDIAAAAAAHGVHLPENSLPVTAVRRSFPSPFLIGASTHSTDAARVARNDGADFIFFGPVFDSGEKKGKGIEELKVVCRELANFPVIALAGIDQTNYQEVLNAGAAGFAAIRYLNRFVRAR